MPLRLQAPDGVTSAIYGALLFSVSADGSLDVPGFMLPEMVAQGFTGDELNVVDPYLDLAGSDRFGLALFCQAHGIEVERLLPAGRVGMRYEAVEVDALRAAAVERFAALHPDLLPVVVEEALPADAVVLDQTIDPSAL